MRLGTATLSRCLQRLRNERGYTVFEMIMVLAILGIVVAGLTAVFVSASKAEIDMNKRFQAQQEARLALERLRREGHCAKAAPTVTVSRVDLRFGKYCKAGATGDYTVTWCTSQVGTAMRYELRRVEPALAATSPCAGGTKTADYLTIGNVFGFVAQSTLSRAKLAVTFPVDVNTSDAVGAYRLRDDIVLRNTKRA